MSTNARDQRDDLRSMKARWHDEHGDTNHFPHDRLLIRLEQFDEHELERADAERSASLPPPSERESGGL